MILRIGHQKRSYTFAFLVVAGSLLLAACQQQASTPGTIFVSGRIEGDETNLAPRIAGRIVEVAVREGETVNAGDTLVKLSGKQTLASREEASARAEVSERRIDQSREEIRVLESRLDQVDIQQQQAGLDSQGRVAQAEGQLAAAQAERARAQAELEQNQADAQRYGELAKRGAVPQQQAEQFATRVKTSEALLEAARKQVAAAEGAVKIARAALSNPQIREAEKVSLHRQIDEARTRVRLNQAEKEAAKATLARADADVGDLTVTAPFAGVVITRAAEPGQVVSSGTTLLTMVDPERLYLRGFVPEGQIGLVKVGQRAEIYLDSAPGEPIEAEVMRIDPEAMFTPENTYFQEDRVRQVVGVKLLLKGSNGGAKLGMPADARIFTEQQASQ
jgi:HlyD family secretion protein